MSVISRPRNKLEARLQALGERRQGGMETWGPRFVLIIAGTWALSFVIGFQNSLTILTILGLACAIFAWRNPYLALLGVSTLFALDAMTRSYLLTGGLLRWNTLNYWMLLVILIAFPFMLRLRDPNTRLLQIFVFLLTIELLVSPRKTTGLQDVINLLSIFGMLYYLARVLKQEGQSFYWLGIVIGVLSAVGNLAFYLQKADLPYINPNAQALFPVTAMYAAVLAFPYARKHPRGRLYLLLLATMNALWIFLSGSRGNMLIGLLCLVFLLFMLRSISWTALFLILAVILGSYLSITFLSDQLYALGRVERLLDPEYTLAERTSGRSVLAEVGWQIFLEHPLGVGTGGFRSYTTEFSTLGYEERPAHSAWVKTLAENGIPGVLLLFAFVVSFIIIGFRSPDRDQRLVGLLVTLAFASAFLSSEFQNKGLFFLAAWATVILHKEDYLWNAEIGGKLKKSQKWALRKYRLGRKVRDERHTP